MSEWRDISTAPDYGTLFLGAYQRGNGTWTASVVTWENALVTVPGKWRFPATHWMPLPAAPAAMKDGGTDLPEAQREHDAGRRG